VLLGLVGGLGCGEPAGVMDEASYIEVMARLSVAQADYIDPARSDSAKLAVLDELGVDPRDLLAFSDRYGGDIERMRRLWHLISARVDSLGAEEMREMSGDRNTESPGGDRP